MASFLRDFRNFALRGNALDLAVGVVIGAAFNGVVTSLVTDVITPPLSVLTGGIDFKTLAWKIDGTNAVIAYGNFLQTLISFVITAFALFLIIRAIMRLEHLARKDPPPPPPVKSPELIVLEEIRDSLQKK
jgi:large conductance mechanosensitive channel